MTEKGAYPGGEVPDNPGSQPHPKAWARRFVDNEVQRRERAHSVASKVVPTWTEEEIWRAMKEVMHTIADESKIELVIAKLRGWRRETHH